jgi:hypothetical protein
MVGNHCKIIKVAAIAAAICDKDNVLKDIN